MTQLHRFINKRQILIEMALLLPVLLLLAIVTFDIGRTIYYYSAVYNASKEGARYGIINPDDISGIVKAAKEFTVGLATSDVSISVCECGGKNACILDDACPVGYNNIIRVKVSYNFQLITPLVNIMTAKDHFSLTSVSYMTITH